jgi:hypothetical protein
MRPEHHSGEDESHHRRKSRLLSKPRPEDERQHENEKREGGPLRDPLAEDARRV